MAELFALSGVADTKSNRATTYSGCESGFVLTLGFDPRGAVGDLGFVAKKGPRDLFEGPWDPVGCAAGRWQLLAGSEGQTI